MEVGCEIEEPFQDSVRIFQMKRHRKRFFSCKIPSDSTDFCAFLVKDVEVKIAKFSSGKCFDPSKPAANRFQQKSKRNCIESEGTGIPVFVAQETSFFEKEFDAGNTEGFLRSVQSFTRFLL